jgi:UDP-glucose 6-dehydrogenase
MFAIIGYGFVGKGTEYLLNICGQSTNVRIHDPAHDLEISNWKHIDYGFLCVPTPQGTDGELDLSILTEVYNMMLDNDVVPVIRSTIGPDQVGLFPKAIMMPEFLREANWISDVEDINTLIIGGDRASELTPVFSRVKSVQVTTAVTAAMYKLSRNALLATKVVLANHIKQVCDSMGADYDQLTEMYQLDNTIGQSHWSVPGPDGKMGFGGKCFPKDLSHMSALCDSDNNLFEHVEKINSEIRGNDDGGS